MPPPGEPARGVEGWAMLATPSTCLCFDSEIRDSIISLLCWVLNMVHPSTLGEGFDFPLRKTANDLAADSRACGGQTPEICSAGAGVG